MFATLLTGFGTYEGTGFVPRMRMADPCPRSAASLVKHSIKADSVFFLHVSLMLVITPGAWANPRKTHSGA